MDNRASVLIELMLKAILELRDIENRRIAQGIQAGDLTPEESLLERLLEKNEIELLALMAMPTHPTRQ